MNGPFEGPDLVGPRRHREPDIPNSVTRCPNWRSLMQLLTETCTFSLGPRASRAVPGQSVSVYRKGVQVWELLLLRLSGPCSCLRT